MLVIDIGDLLSAAVDHDDGDTLSECRNIIEEAMQVAGEKVAELTGAVYVDSGVMGASMGGACVTFSGLNPPVWLRELDEGGDLEEVDDDDGSELEG